MASTKIWQLCFYVTLLLVITACKATPKKTEYWTIEQAAFDTVVQINKLKKSGRLQASAKFALEVGFLKDDSRPCESVSSIEFKKSFLERMTVDIPSMSIPAFDDAKLTSFYSGDSVFNVTDWQVDFIVFAQLNVGKSDNEKNVVPEINVKILTVSNNTQLIYLNYPLKVKSTRDFVRPIKCDCQRLCQQNISLFAKERITGAFKQQRKCLLPKTTQLLTMPNCSTELMLGANSALGGMLSSNFVVRQCSNCGGQIPSLEALDNLRLCLPIKDRGYNLPCLFNGAIKECYIGLESVTVSDIQVNERKFNGVQCEFEHQ